MKGEIDMKYYLGTTDTMSKVTKEVITNFNKLSDQAFMNKYSISKFRYFKRVKKYGDPYMKAPLAKIGKFLLKLQKSK